MLPLVITGDTKWHKIAAVPPWVDGVLPSRPASIPSPKHFIPFLHTSSRWAEDAAQIPLLSCLKTLRLEPKTNSGLFLPRGKTQVLHSLRGGYLLISFMADNCLLRKKCDT